MDNYNTSLSYYFSRSNTIWGESKKLMKSQHPDSNKARRSTPGTTGNCPLKPIKKRQQVKNACVNCQKACKKCDEGRPCSRCIKYGLVDTCTDSPRKARKKGVKRGPYRRRKLRNSPQTITQSGREAPSDDITTLSIHDQSNVELENTYTTYRPYQPYHPCHSYHSYPSATFGTIKESAFVPGPGHGQGQGKGTPPRGSWTHTRRTGDEYENLSLLSYFCQKEHNSVDDISQLVNPRVHTLQVPQPRRFSVDIPTVPRVGLAPRSNSVDPDNRYGHIAGQYRARSSEWPVQESKRGGLTIEIPMLPSISTITSRASQQPSTPAPVLPPLKNVPDVVVSHEECRSDVTNVEIQTTRRGSIPRGVNHFRR